MGGITHSSLVCCCGLRRNNQCCYPCSACCNNFKDKAPFYNFDGSEAVDPLVCVFKPSKNLIRRNFVPGIVIDNATLRRGLGPVEQLTYLCKYAQDNHFKVKAVGKGMSWNKITSTRDILVVMTSLNRILTPRNKSKGDDSREIEVEGGMLMKKFVRALDKKYGLALPVVGSFLGQTVAGALSTATHGSGYHAQTMSAYVVAVRLIIGGGIQVIIRGGNESIHQCQQRLSQVMFGEILEINSDEVLKSVSVSLGAMGIIYSVTFACIPTFRLKEARIELDMPVQPDQPFRVPENFENLYRGPKDTYFSFFINQTPRTDPETGFAHDAVYLQSHKTKKSPTCGGCCHACCAWWCLPGGRGCSDSCCCQGDIAASAVLGCIRNNPHCATKFNTCVLDSMTRSYPFHASYYKVLEISKGRTHVRTAEFAIPIDVMEKALQDIFQITAKYKSLYVEHQILPLYCRLVKSDDLPLSPANKHRPDGTTVEHYMYIELPFLPGTYGVENYLELIENTLVQKYKARPHWGKNHNLQYATIKALYPGLETWEKVYRMFNPDKIFDNDFTVRCGFCTSEDYAYIDTTTPMVACPTQSIDMKMVSTDEVVDLENNDNIKSDKEMEDKGPDVTNSKVDTEKSTDDNLTTVQN
ncbi:L-gulono-1,4-lactone dehydrogenase [Trichoplax sp. H2]|nr:L-gulono-1,4-lactone dehydrogenase [Trichoplax sp. H2]|eukprot:RDD46996.1 L-gulono-1,4-lactone dehydrogenase [Trichoplax sp. H2]